MRKRTFGGFIGYSSGKKSSSLNIPPKMQGLNTSSNKRAETKALNGLSGSSCCYSPSYGDCPGPATLTSKCLRLSSFGAAEIPGGESAISRSVSCKMNTRVADSRCGVGKVEGKRIMSLVVSDKPRDKGQRAMLLSGTVCDCGMMDKRKPSVPSRFV